LTSTFFQRMSAGSLLPIPQQFKVRTVRSFDRAHEETAELHWFLPELGPIGEPGSDPLTWNSDDKGWGVLHSDGAFNAGFQEGRGGFHNYPKLGYKAHELGSIENKLAYCTHQNMQPWNGWTYLGAGQTNLNYPLDPTSEEHPGPIPEYTSPGTGGLYRGDTITTPFVDMEKVADVDNPHKDGWWCPFSGYLSVYCDKMYSFHAGVLPEPVGQETDFDNPAPFSWPATLARYDPKTGESKAWALSNSLYLGSFATARDPISVHCAEILADTFNSEGGEDSETCLFEFQSDCGHVDGFDSHCPHCSDDTGISGGSIYLTSRKNGPGTPDCFGNPCPYFQCPDDPDGGFPTIYGSSVEMNIHACAVAPPDCPELRDGIDYITVRTAGLIPLDLPPGDPYQFNGMAKCMTPNPNPCIGKGGGVMNCAQNGECSPHPIDGLPVDPDCGVFLAQLQYCSNIEYTMHVLVKAKSGCFLSYFFTLTGRPNTTIHP
jgi:hypothetical protein